MRVNKLLTVALTLLLAAGLCLPVLAGNPEKKGSAGAEELLIPMGARGTALAGAANAAVSGVDAIYWNPAGVGRASSSVEAMFSYMTYIADININYGAVAVKTGIGSLGFSFQAVDFGEIAQTTELAPEGTGSFFSPSYMTLAATYSRAMTDRIYVGANIKFISEKIMNTGGSTWAVDMGVQYLTDIGLRLGVALKNFGAPIKFTGGDLERSVDIPNAPVGTPSRNLAIPAQRSELPSMFEIGLAYDVKPMEKFNVSVMGNFRNNNFSNDELNGGVEVNFNEMVFLRGGYNYATNEGTDAAGGNTYIFGPTFGFGLMYPITPGMKLAFDFTYRTADYFDNNMIFTAKMLF